MVPLSIADRTLPEQILNIYCPPTRLRYKSCQANDLNQHDFGPFEIDGKTTILKSIISMPA